MKYRIIPVFYVCIATVAGLLLIEFVCQKVNSANGIYIPLIKLNTIHSASFGQKNMFSVIDPHLGYARRNTEYLINKLQKRYSWVEGFAVYSKKATPNLETPIILVLGGSTTDGVHNDHSWPEELSKLLAQRKVSGTVVNGGTSGYSSNQELLKLLRDGLEFKPNIIISYSGVNDRGDYGKLPYPMVHPYQRATLKFLTSPAYSPLFPNTIYFLNGILSGSSPVRMSATLGIPTRRTLGQQFERNMILMDAIARASGATFYGIIQPNDYVGSGGQLKGPKKEVISKHYVAKLRNFYGQIRDVPVRLPFVRSFISIFDGEDTTYADDGVHTTLKGDQIIAARVLDLIYADLRGSEITRAPAQSAPCIKQ